MVHPKGIWAVIQYHEKYAPENKQKTFICWRQRFIIIPGVSPSPPPRPTNDQDRQHRCVDSKQFIR